jgi:hypothetical protein
MPLLSLFAVFVGVPVRGLLLGGLAARLLGLAKPVVVALAGLMLNRVGDDLMAVPGQGVGGRARGGFVDVGE